MQPGMVVIDPRVVHNKAKNAVPPRKFLGRMLHNLKQIYIGRREPHNTLAIIRYLRCVRTLSMDSLSTRPDSRAALPLPCLEAAVRLCRRPAHRLFPPSEAMGGCSLAVIYWDICRHAHPQTAPANFKAAHQS